MKTLQDYLKMIVAVLLALVLFRIFDNFVSQMVSKNPSGDGNGMRTVYPRRRWPGIYW